MTAALEEFVRAHPNIFILPEVWSGNLLPLLKRLKANVVGIMTNAPVNPEKNVIQTPSGNYPLINFQDIMSKLNPQTGIIISSAKPMPNPNFSPTFSIGEIKISIPAFALNDEEARVIYDRLIILQVIKQYHSDGLPTDIKNFPYRLARGISTFMDPRLQDIKVYIRDRQNLKMPSYDVEDTAIVMQGPLWYEDNYTINTAQFYRQWYPNAPIIISTWKNEATEAFREVCKKIGVVLLENDLPADSGYGHINYQLESSLKGVEYIKDHTSVRYALKCRTDQRFNRTDFLIYFKNLLRTFPPNGDKMEERMIMIRASKCMPFYVSDFLYFSTVEILNNLFNISNQKKAVRMDPEVQHQRVLKIGGKFSSLKLALNLTKLKEIDERKLRNYNIAMCRFDIYPPEIFILRSFYKKHIESLNPAKALQTYLKFLRDYLIVVEKNDLLFDWPKYSTNQPPTIAYGVDFNYEESMTYIDWLDVYLNYKDDDE